MVIVLFDRNVTKGRAFSLPAKAFVLFGAAVLLGIAAMMYVEIQPTITKILTAGLP